MSSLNEAIKNISLVEIAIVLIIALAVIVASDLLFSFEISEEWMYVALILFVVFKLRDYSFDFCEDARNIFSSISPRSVILIVAVNVFFSYGMLYGFNMLLIAFPSLNDLLFSQILTVKSSVVFKIASTVLIAPVAEELIFRGVLLNRLSRYFSLPLAVVVSSILFGLMHDPGSVVSAFVFGLCMAIMYIRSQNILLPIFAHFLNNLIAEILYLGDTSNLIFTNPIVIIAFSLLAAMSLYLIAVSLKAEWKKLV